MADVPASFTTVTPTVENLPDNGVPTTTPDPNPADPRRRVFRTAVVDCTGFSGTQFINYNQIEFVDMFITEPAGDPSDFTIFLEVIRSRGTYNDLQLIANAKLIE